MRRTRPISTREARDRCALRNLLQRGRVDSFATCCNTQRMATVQTSRGWLSEGDVSNLFHRNIGNAAIRRLCAAAIAGNSNAQEAAHELIAGEQS